MANVQDIVKLAKDYRHGVGSASKYSKSDVQASLREALIELNGGSTKFDPRRARDGRIGEIYSVIEEVIKDELNDYWTNNDIVNRICDYRNAALGDELSFYVPDNSLFAVAAISEGNANIRRQRIMGGKTVTPPIQLRGVKIYEEFIRVLAGRVDFNDMIDRALSSMKKDAYEQVMNAWNTIDYTLLGDAYVLPNATVVKGTYDESKLLDIIAHVEAETGAAATIYGTKKALRAIASSVAKDSESGKDEMNNLGYIGKFYGNDVIALQQAHKTNTTEFVLDDNSVYVLASDDKPIKYVTEGDPLIIQKDPLTNADLTYEWLYTERTGVGIVVNEVFGKYTFS